ncbi:sulfatase family protein, partial [Vibrio parahaemolyticus V-223/04]
TLITLKILSSVRSLAHAV